MTTKPPARAVHLFPWRMFGRVVLVNAAVLFIALLVAGISARQFLKRQFLDEARQQLKETVIGLSHEMPVKVTEQWCAIHTARTQLRLTVIEEGGRVLCDSWHESQTMEDHATRPEVVEARTSGSGSSQRFSRTLGREMLYVAVRSDDTRHIVRAARDFSHFHKIFRALDLGFWMFLAGLAALLAGFALWSGRMMFAPLGRLLYLSTRPEAESEPGDLTEGLYGELSEFESSLLHMRKDLVTKSEGLATAREELATLMGAVSDAIYAADLEGNALFYNSSFGATFGTRLGKGSEFRLREVFREPSVLKAYDDAARKGQTSSVAAVRWEDESGVRFFKISVSALRRGTSGVYGAIGIFHDVTALKRADQMRIDFVANVSHELRTPVTAIKGYADTLLVDVAEGKPAEKKFLETISRNSDRLAALVDDLLDLSSLDSSAHALNCEQVATREVTERVLQQMGSAFKDRQQTIELDCAAERVFADSDRVEQVLTNLLDNARKYSPAGGKISVRWAPAENGGTKLSIADSGPGIAPEHHSRLFERFYRVDKARSRELGGTGLGLAIVKHIMQRHGGAVWVESEPGKGATFHCLFPGMFPDAASTGESP